MEFHLGKRNSVKTSIENRFDVIKQNQKIQHEDKEQAQSIIMTYPESNKEKVFQMYLSVSY